MASRAGCAEPQSPTTKSPRSNLPQDDVSVPNLDRGGPLLQNLAVASLRQKASIGIRVAPHDSCREHPRLHQYLRVFHRDVVHECIALTRKSLDDMHPIRVEETTAPDPRRIGERDRVEH